MTNERMQIQEKKVRMCIRTVYMSEHDVNTNRMYVSTNKIYLHFCEQNLYTNQVVVYAKRMFRNRLYENSSHFPILNPSSLQSVYRYPSQRKAGSDERETVALLNKHLYRDIIYPNPTPTPSYQIYHRTRTSGHWG